MQATVVMLMALTGLGCHHKKCEPVYETSCYSSCYSSSGCYSSCYSGGYASMYGGCYSSCYSSMGSCYSSMGSCYSSMGSCYSSMGSCYSSCYSAKRHRHGLFGHKRKSCGACYEPAPVYATAYSAPACDPCGSSMPVFGTYTPVYGGYASSQYQPSSQGTVMSAPAPYSAPATPEPSTPTESNPAMPDSGTPAPPPVPTPAPAPAPAPPPAAGF